MTQKKNEQAKEAIGTSRKDRVHVPLTFQPLHEIPQPLEELTPRARKYYEYVCTVLISNELLTSADIPAITQAACFYGIFGEANELVTKDGYFQTTSTGYTAKNAHVQVMTDSFKSVKVFEDKYGFNLSSRDKISIKPTTSDDPLSKFI